MESIPTVYRLLGKFDSCLGLKDSEEEEEEGGNQSVDRSSIIRNRKGEEHLGWLRFWYPRHAAVLYVSMHMGRLTKVKTLYSIMMEKQRKTAYRTRT